MDARPNPDPGSRRDECGFSLVELLVALAFTAVLMAGMASVFKSSVQTYTAVNETMGAQRTNRWALDQISDDFSQAGYVFPDRPLPTHILTGSESLFSITPGVAVVGVTRVSDTNPTATQAESVTSDIVQFFTDLPLPISGFWAADTTGEDSNPGGVPTAPPASAAITFTLGAASDLKAGDVMLILDGGEKGSWEHPLITGPGNPVVFETDATKLTRYVSAQTLAGGIRNAHKAGVPVAFIRPAQVIRYVVQAVALDPANSAVRLPCLVRQQADYPLAGTIDWTTATTQILAENVEGFRVDMSFDGGTTWARTTGSPTTWAAIQANANTQLSTVGLPSLNSLTDPANPDWFRGINCLFRIDITTRAPIRREEYSTTAGARAYRTRTQTLMISPRNFGYTK
jgi:type II secretory pathway pseudopilin PulG